jgi:chaperonin GroEL (HSP60 family)
LNDLPLLKTEFDSCGISFIFFSADSLFKPLPVNNNKRLPSRYISCYDKDLQILNSLLDNNSVSSGSLPLIILADSRGNILYRSTGYRIGIGEQILKRIRK